MSSVSSPHSPTEALSPGPPWGNGARRRMTFQTIFRISPFVNTVSTCRISATQATSLIKFVFSQMWRGGGEFSTARFIYSPLKRNTALSSVLYEPNAHSLSLAFWSHLHWIPGWAPQQEFPRTLLARNQEEQLYQLGSQQLVPERGPPVCQVRRRHLGHLWWNCDVLSGKNVKYCMDNVANDVIRRFETILWL